MRNNYLKLILFSPAITLFLFIVCTGCNHSEHNHTPSARQGKAAAVTQEPEQGLTPAILDSIAAVLMDSILSQKDMIPLDSIIEEGRGEMDSNADYSAICRTTKGEAGFRVEAGHSYLLLQGIKLILDGVKDINNEAGALGNSAFLEVLSYRAFSFRGKQYSLLTAGPYQCNGTGCLSEYNFFYDHQNKRLSYFYTFDSHLFYGDLNHDNMPDFLKTTFGPSLVIYQQNLEDSAQGLYLEAYTINSRGLIVPLKNKGRNSFREYVFDSVPPYRVKLKSENWFGL